MIKITLITPYSYHDLSIMLGELLNEIMDSIGERAFNYDRNQTEKRAKALIEQEKYWVFMARDSESSEYVGFVSLYESYALYAEGAFGTIPELYVRPQWRSRNIGKLLLDSIRDFADQKGWNRLEVTTPPLPQFERTLAFYQQNGFSISGGRKLKTDL